MDQVERFRGCMLGLAVGDALGMPVEGFSAREIREKVGSVRNMMPSPPGHFHTGLVAGQYTDDTEETLILARSMIDASGFSCDHFSKALMDWGSSWILDQSLNRGVGFTSRSSIEAMLSGKSWRESGLDTPTCGSAMRVAPIGLVYHFDLNLVARYAELQSLPTHTAPSARAGAIALAVGVALGLMGFPRFKVWEIATDFAWRTDRPFSSKLKMIKELLSEDPKDAMEAIGTSPAVDEAVPAAFYCYLCFEPPEDALVQAASHGGDTDSIASMAGALLGAAKGPSWIPQKWLDPLEGRKKLEMTAEALENLSSQINERRRGDFI